MHSRKCCAIERRSWWNYMVLSGIDYAGMAELVDALVLGTSTSVWGFDSLYPHQNF